MNINIKKYFLIVLINISGFCFTYYVQAQEGFIIHPDGGQYMINRGSWMSASYHEVDKQFYSSYGNRLGLLSDIRTLYAEGIFGINTNQTAGLKLYSEQETSLFRKTSIAMTYGIVVSLDEQLDWTFATDLSTINIFFGASESTAGGSAWTFNGNFSTVLHHEKYELGIAAHQIPYQSITPINFAFQLNTYYQAYALYKINTMYFDIHSAIRTQYHGDFQLFFDNHIIYQNTIGLLLSFSNTYQAGLSYTYESKSTSYTGFLSYEGPLNNSVPGQNEVHVGVLIEGI